MIAPKITLGDPAYVPGPEETDLDGNPRLTGCRVDLGAYEAAMEQLPADFDGNARVNLADLAGFQLCMGASGAMAKRSAAMHSSRTLNIPAFRLRQGLGVPHVDWLDTCLCLFDADESGDIDLYDFTAFHALLVGE